MAGRARQRWIFYALVGAILLALPVAYFLLLERDPPPPQVTAPPPPEEPKAVALRVGKLSGEVQVRRGGGEWAPASADQPLQGNDTVRTLDGAYAVLIGGEAYEIRMEPGTEVTIDELTSSLSKFMLGRGMAQADVKGGARHTFEVRASGSDAVARTQEGRFAISSNGAGTVAVGTREGEVEFSGKGKTVIVRAGQQSVIRPGQAPSEPGAIPSSLLLKVQWPAQQALRQRKLVISGTAEPGARVEVAGKTATVGADGRFVQSLTLVEGKNAVDIRAQSIGGVTENVSRQVLVDTTPPKVGVDPDLWR